MKNVECLRNIRLIKKIEKHMLNIFFKNLSHDSKHDPPPPPPGDGEG